MKRLIKRNGFVKRILQIAMAVAIMVSPLLMIAKPNKSVYARLHTSDLSYTSIGNSNDDLYQGGTIKTANLQALFNIITGSSDSTYGDVQATIQNATGHVLTSADLKSHNNTLNSQDKYVNIWFGGLEWTVTYISQSTDGSYENDIIATLWLADYGASNIMSMWSDRWAVDNPTDDYPTNMYGSSYIRAELNGGYYITGVDENGDPILDELYHYDHAVSGQINPSTTDNEVYLAFSAFADGGNLAQFITKPSKVSWQEKGQKTSRWSDWDYDCPNENWGAITTNYGSLNENAITASDGTNTYTFWANSSDSRDNNNFGSGSEHTTNSAWKDDNLWLPSMSEVGYDASHVGLWETSDVQRKFGDGSIEWIESEYNSWLRSGDYMSAFGAHVITPSGSFDYEMGGAYCAFNASVRPALHLNLKDVAQEAGLISEFPNTGVSGTISAVIIVAVGVMLLVILVSYAMITTKPKRIVR